MSQQALETHKLDLMAEVSSLKLKLAIAEKTRRESDERYLQCQVAFFENILTEMQVS